MNTQTTHQFSHEELPPEIAKMTLEEFLESDLEGYEYVKGELISVPPTSLEHGKISVNLILPLGLYVRENQRQTSHCSRGMTPSLVKKSLKAFPVRWQSFLNSAK